MSGDAVCTRIAYVPITPEQRSVLDRAATRLGRQRKELWNEHGSGLSLIEKSFNDFKKEWTASGRMGSYRVHNTYAAETFNDVAGDISARISSAKASVRKDIRRRFPEEADRIDAYNLLRKGDWTSSSFLHRRMRKALGHGHTSVDNQILVRSDRYTWNKETQELSCVYGTFRLKQNVPLKGNLRFILKDECLEIHHHVDPSEKSTKTCGTLTVGVDMGHTEVFTDNLGNRYGEGLGKVVDAQSDLRTLKGKRRSQLRAAAHRSR